MGLRSRGGQLDRLDDRGIVVFRFVDPCRDRPHPHWLGRVWPHQVARVGLITQPTGVIGGREDERHAIMDFGYQFIGIGRDDRESANPLACAWVFPVLPQPAKAERATVHMAMA